MITTPKWNDATIERGIRELHNQLGHFPSITKLRELGRNDLACAITKSGGTLKWSERLGIARQHSDSDTGWDGENAVKQILTERGFKVEVRGSVKCPYDLLLDSRVRCDVKTAKLATYTEYPAWYYRIGKDVQCDIVILYQSDTKDCFIYPWFEVGSTNMTISPHSPKHDPFKNRFDIIESYARAVKSITY